MGPPLGPASANLFMSYSKSQLLKHGKVSFNKRYFDSGIVSFFRHENEVNQFFRFINQ